MKPRVTQKDVARAAGVSHAAVSLALREHPSIPPQTRERIKKAAQKLGYVPDPMLSGLAAYRMSQRPAAYKANIAWINRHEPRQLTRGELAEYLAGGRARAKELGYGLELISMEALGNNAKRLEKILIAKGITGIVLPPSVHYGGELKIDYQRFSAVRLGYSYRHPVLHTIVNAQFKTAFHTFQKVLAAGYRRIGIVLSADLDQRTDWNFLGGFRAAQQQLPKAQRIEPLYPDKPGSCSLETWVKRNRLDAVIGTCAPSAIQDLKMGLGYASLSLEHHESRLSGMYQNTMRIGAAAVEQLISMMHRGETGLPAEPAILCIPSRWIDGKTLPQKQN